MEGQSSPYNRFARGSVDDLARKSVRSGIVALSSQVVRLLLQAGTLVILARTLNAEDFGLQGMVLVLTSFLAGFRDAGLGAATVQRLEITHVQVSTLFWINVAFGAFLAAITAAFAPALAAFYNEPRLYWITIISAVTFVFSGTSAQHLALLVRDMRFGALAKIDLCALLISSACGLYMALSGWHYWALVAMAVVGPIVSAIGAWLALSWIPGPPRRGSGVSSMLHFGWKSACQSLIYFLTWNSDNILIGRFWGADALGLYGRAYQLATLPVQQLTWSLNGVAFSALSRIQDDPERLRASFLRAYRLLISVTIPMAIISSLFAGEIVHVVLGARWMESVPIFKLLAPAALWFPLTTPLSWLVMSTGRVNRELRISLVVTPILVIGVVAGLAFGPQGVALCYSIAMALLVIPITAWSKRGTNITWMDLWNSTRASIVSGVIAGALGFAVKMAIEGRVAPGATLILGLMLVLSVYAWALLILMRQRDLYVDLLMHLMPTRA